MVLTSVTLRVGPDRDIFHGLAVAAALSDSGICVDVWLSQSAVVAAPPDIWLKPIGCRSVCVAPDDAPRGDLVIDICGADAPGASITVPSVPAGTALTWSIVGDRRIRLDAAVHATTGYLAAVRDAVAYASAQAGDLAGRRVVVTAGGTREPLDPIRFITNRSSGKMGYAMARAARDRGAEVTLIATTAALGDLVGVDLVVAPDVRRLRDAVLAACSSPAILVMAAAVSDFRPRAAAAEKIKKDANGILLHLETIANFIPEIPPGTTRIGFAAETNSDIALAAAKRIQRGFDLLCLNDVSKAGIGFETDTNEITIIGPEGVRATTGVVSKIEAAHRILDEVARTPAG